MMRLALSSALLVALTAACGSDDGAGAAAPPPQDPTTSEAGRTVVIGDGTGRVYATPSGADCVQIGNECVKPQEKCGADARADVIVDSAGKPVAIVCYPAESAPPVIDENGNVDLDKKNKGVVAVDGNADGVDIAGDVTSSGNKVTVYGKGAGVSVIGGSVDSSGNNFSLRGVTVQKNVKVKGNNATVVLCQVDGDLTIEGNNAVVAECSVFGNFKIVGQNAVLVANKVGGDFKVEGDNPVCDGNVKFADANGDKIAQTGELGAPLTCAK